MPCYYALSDLNVYSYIFLPFCQCNREEFSSETDPNTHLLCRRRKGIQHIMWYSNKEKVPWVFMWPYRVEKSTDMSINSLLKAHCPHFRSNALVYTVNNRKIACVIPGKQYQNINFQNLCVLDWLNVKFKVKTKQSPVQNIIL